MNKQTPLLSKAQFKQALSENVLDENQVAFLKAIFSFSGQRALPKQIAQKLGWKSPTSGNAMIGKIGQLLSFRFNIKQEHIPIRDKASSLTMWWTVWGFETPGDEKFWNLRGELVEALKEIDIDSK